MATRNPRRVVSIVAGFLLTTVAGIGLPAVTAAPANAALCGGSHIAHKKIRNRNNTLLGYLDVYYNAATGRNCAVVSHSSNTWGKRFYTQVNIWTPTKPYRQDFDGKIYKYYAGPVSIRAKGRCVHVSGTIHKPKTLGGSVLVKGHCN